MYNLTVAAPAALYAPILLGFLSSCLISGQTQEESLGLMLAIVEPLAALHMVRLMRDACRQGLNAHCFDLPLNNKQWRWLLFSLVFHG